MKSPSVISQIPFPGNQGNAWRLAEVQLAEGIYPIVFQGTAGSTTTQHISLDDIDIRPGSCTGQGSGNALHCIVLSLLYCITHVLTLLSNGTKHEKSKYLPLKDTIVIRLHVVNH